MSKIYDYLLKHDQNVIQVNVDCMVRDHATAISPGTTTTPLRARLQLSRPPTRRTSLPLPRLMQGKLDHKTNRYNYHLLTFMAMNEFEEGAVVQQSLLEANGDWHM
ncbi:hypothetical protein V7S43_000288 [Phytophthora oleae]|uniref:Uncharacterized protein n=1 Tax=Phytophthora oleae TaxID=2107226 RepID=A0ABD3G812_9STRA